MHPAFELLPLLPGEDGKSKEGGGGTVGMDILPTILRLPEAPRMTRDPPPIKDKDFKAFLEPLYSRGWGIRYQTAYKTLDEAVKLHGGEVAKKQWGRKKDLGDDGVRLVNVFSFTRFETALQFAMEAGAIGREEPVRVFLSSAPYLMLRVDTYSDSFLPPTRSR